MSAIIFALVAAGAVLLVTEAHVVSHGLLGLTGTACLCAALVLAADEAGLPLAVAVALALVVAAAAAVCVALTVARVRRVLRRRALVGVEELVGRVGVVRHDVAPIGDVAVRGELWRARRSPLEAEDARLVAGEHVVIDRVSGLTVSVRRAEEWELPWTS